MRIINAVTHRLSRDEGAVTEEHGFLSMVIVAIIAVLTLFIQSSAFGGFLGKVIIAVITQLAATVFQVQV